MKSKTNNTSSKRNKKIEDSLREIGMTIDEVYQWLDEENCKKQKGTSYCNSSLSCNKAECGLNESQDMDSVTGNVQFIPANFTEDAQVYVEGIKIEGVINASLEYDAAYPHPVLKLTIHAPQVGGREEKYNW